MTSIKLEIREHVWEDMHHRLWGPQRRYTLKSLGEVLSVLKPVGFAFLVETIKDST